APAPAAPAAAAPSAAAAAAPAAHGPSAGSPPQLIHLVTPSRLFPELVATRGLVATEDGTQRCLVVRPNGAVDRAEELFPIGSVSSIALPSRLGGGYLFHASSGTGTEIWRASSWLGKLTPLTRRNEPVADILPGFDRIYL